MHSQSPDHYSSRRKPTFYQASPPPPAVAGCSGLVLARQFIILMDNQTLKWEGEHCLENKLFWRQHRPQSLWIWFECKTVRVQKKHCFIISASCLGATWRGATRAKRLLQRAINPLPSSFFKKEPPPGPNRPQTESRPLKNWNSYSLQRWEKVFANLAKQHPGRARQKS